MTELPRTNLYLDLLDEEHPDYAQEWRLKNPERVPFGLEEQELRRQTAAISQPLDASMPSIAQVPSSVPIQQFPQGVGFGALEHFSRQIIRTKQEAERPTPPVDWREGDTIGDAMREAFRRDFATTVSSMTGGLAGLTEAIGKQHEGVPSTFAPSPLSIEGLGQIETFDTGQVMRQLETARTTDSPRGRFYSFARRVDEIGEAWKRQLMPGRGPRVPEIASIGSARDAVVYFAESFAGASGSTVPSLAAGIASGLPGMFGTSSLMSMGQVRDSFERAGVRDAARRDSYVLTAGLMMGALDAISLSYITRGFISRQLVQHAATSIPRRVLAASARGLVSEAFTELAQDAIDVAAVAHYQGEDVARAWWDARIELRESFIRGGIGGAGMAGTIQAGRETVAAAGRGVRAPRSIPDFSTLEPQRLPDVPAQAPDHLFQPERERAAGERTPAPTPTPEAPAPTPPPVERVPARDEEPLEEPRLIYDQDEIAVLVAATDGLSDEDRMAIREAALGDRRDALARAARIYGETGDMASAIQELRQAILWPEPAPEAQQAEAELRRFEAFAGAEPLTADERAAAIADVMEGAEPRDAYEDAAGPAPTPDPRQIEQFEPLEAVLEEEAAPSAAAQVAAREPARAQEMAIPRMEDIEREVASLEIAMEADRQTISDLRDQLREVRGQRETIAQLRAEIEEASKRISGYSRRLKQLQEQPVEPAPAPQLQPQLGASPSQPATVGPTEEQAAGIRPKKRTWGGPQSKTPATGLRLIDWIIRAGGIRPYRSSEGTTGLFGGQVRPAEGIRAAASKRFGKDAVRRPGVFTSGGYTLDDAALWDALVDAGYIPPYLGPDGIQIYDPASRIEEMLADDLNDRAIYSAEYDQTATPIDPEEEAHAIVSEAIALHERNGAPYTLTEVEEDRLVELVRQGMYVDDAIERIYIEAYNADEAPAPTDASAADAGRAQPPAPGPSGQAEEGTRGGRDADAGEGRQPAGGGAETHIDPYAFSVVGLLKRHGFASRDPDPDARREAQIAAMKAAALELQPFSFESLKAMAEAQKVYGGNPAAKNELIDIMLKAAAQRIARRPASQRTRFQFAPETATGYRNFYSSLRHQMQRAKMGVAPGKEWSNFVRSLLQKGALKKEEVQWSGLEAFLEENAKSRLSREEILRFLEAHQVEVTERVHSERLAPARASLAEALSFRARTISSAQRLKDHRALRSFVAKAGGREQAVAILVDGPRPGSRIALRDRNDILDVIARAFPDLHQAIGEGAKRSWERMVVKSPLGQDYNEILIRLPMLRQRWTSPHYNDHEIVHVRFDTITGPNGERLLRLQEIQSDLHQMGRDRGYARELTEVEQRRLEDLREISLHRLRVEDDMFRDVEQAYDRAIAQFPDSLPALRDAVQRAGVDLGLLHEAIRAGILQSGREVFGSNYYGVEQAIRDEAISLFPEVGRLWAALQAHQDETVRLEAERNLLEHQISSVPDAPFKDKAWLELALKRMLLYAVESNFDGITWNRADEIGPAVGARTIRSATWRADAGGIAVAVDDGRRRTERSYKIGKDGRKSAIKLIRRELGDRIADAIEAREEGRLYSLSEATVGMRLQYDHEIGEFLARYTRQWGGKIDRTQPAEFFSPLAFWNDVKQIVIETADATEADQVDSALRQLLTDMDALTESDPDQTPNETHLAQLDDWLNTLPERAYAELWPRLEDINNRWEHDFRTGKLVRPQALSNQFLMITDAMKQSVPKGQPLFMPGGPFSSRSPAYKALLREAVLEAIEPMRHMLPPAVQIAIAERLDELDPDTALELLELGATLDNFHGAALPHRRLVVMSVSSGEYPQGGPKATLGHEIVHMLRGMGLIHDREWRVLIRYANKVRVLDQRPPGDTKTLREIYEEGYADYPPDLRRELIDEEAVAFLLQQRIADGESFAVPINNLLDRLIEFLIRLKNALLLRGFRNDVDVIVGRIRTGEIARRYTPPATANLSAATLFSRSIMREGQPYRPPQAHRIWQLGLYRVEREDFEGSRTYYVYDRGSDTPISYTVAVDRGEAGWEIEWTETVPGRRREGVNATAYKAIEKDLGQPRKPSGTLLPDGYEMWKARDPEAVKHHRQWGRLWYSPKQLIDIIQLHEELAQEEPNPERRRVQRKMAAEARAILETIPSAARSPERLATMFSRSSSHLDMSAEARKARAEAMGFDTREVLYHGTAGAFEAFRLPEAGGFEGAQSEPAVWLTDVKQEAERYANEALIAEGGETRIIEVYVRPGRQLIVTSADLPGLANADGSMRWDQEEFDRILAEARENGYDSVRFKRVVGWEIPTDQIAVFDPANIRSVDAAFDPAASSSSNIRFSLSRPLARPPGGLRDTRDRPAGGRPGTGAPQSSLRQIIDRLARDLDLAIRRGRLSEAERRRARQQDAELLAQYDETTGVIRTQVYDDLNRMSHEAGHALATRIGQPLIDVIARNDAELGPLDPLHSNPNEGFAEFIRRYLTNPTAARRAAPATYAEFELAMATVAPEILTGLQNAQQAYTEWLASASYGAIGLSVVSTAERTGFEVARDLYAHARSNTLPELLQQGAQQIDHMAHRAYFANFDRAHPIRRAVDWLTAVARENLPDMPGAQNLRILAANDPYVLFRMMKGAWEAGRSAIVNGVAPYSRLSGRLPAPEGPSLYSALTRAFGSNRWTREQEMQFGSYLKSRMMVMRFIQWRPELMEELRRHVAVNPQHAYLLANAAVYERMALGDPANGVEGRPLPYQPDEFSFGDHLQNLVEQETANPRLARAADDYYGFVRNLVKKAHDAGLPGMTPENYAELIARPDYAPMWRDMSDPGDVVAPDQAAGASAGGMTRGNRRAVIKGAFQGSSRPVINPLESAMQMAYQIEAAIAYNETVAALANIARAAGPGGGVIAERLSPTRITANQVEVQHVIERAAQELGVDPLDTAFLLAQVNDILGENAMATLYRRTEIRPGTGERILWYGENGRLVPLLIGNAPLAREVFDVIHQFGLHSPQWDFVLNMLGLSSMTLRASIVLEPIFQIRNFIRDQISYYIQAPGYIPVWTGLRGLRHVAMGSELFRAYQAQGGMMGGPATATIEPTRMKRRVAALQRGGFRIDFSFAGVRDIFRGFEFLETASRVGYAEIVYRRAIRQGLSPYDAMRQAVWESRDIMDFDKSGGWLTVTRRLVPFLNANLVGLDRSIRVLVGRAERDRGAVIRRVMSPFASGGLQQSPVWNEVRQEDWPHYISAWLRLAAVAAVYATIRILHSGEEDEDESNDYENAIFSKIRVNGEWLFLPKPYDFAAVINLAEAAAVRSAGGNTRAMEGWFNGLFHTVMPPHDVPGLRTIYGLRANYDDFFGRPIVPKELLGLEAHLQYNHWTSEFSKALSRQLSPIASISPAAIDYVITNQFGTWGRHFLNATNMAARGLDETDWRDWTGGLVRPIERSTLSGQRFWEMLGDAGEYTVAANTLQRLSTMVTDARTIARYLDSLSPERRAYAILHMAGTQGQQQFHPLDRARAINGILGGILRDISYDRLRTTEAGRRMRKEPGEPIDLGGREKLALRGLLQTIQFREQANALIVMREPGWTHRKLYSTQDDFALLKERFPVIFEEVEKRLGAAGVRDFEPVRDGWPALRSTLLSDETRTELINGDYDAIEAKLPAVSRRRSRSSRTTPLRLSP